VTVAGAAAKFDRTAETLNVMLSKPAKRGDKLLVVISYHGHPKDGLIFAKDRDGNPSVTGDNWPNRVHYWIPSLDHPSAKATVSFTISVPNTVTNGRMERLSIIANGAGTEDDALVTRWHFRETKPIPPYCMVIAVNHGVIIKPTYQTTTNLLFNVAERDLDYAPQ